MAKVLTRGLSDSAIPSPKSMTRPKRWSEEVEEAYRFQLAGYRDECEYKHIQRVEAEGIDRWQHNGFVKKLKTKDGYFYYYNKERECQDRDVHRTKIYAY